MDPVIAVILRGALALLFVAAATHKLRDRDAFRVTLGAYALLPESALALVARVLPLVEIAIAVLLVTPRLGGAGAVLAASLLALYAGAMAINLARGRRDLDCGCMGAHAASKVGAPLIVRNAVLIVASLACLVPIAARPVGWLDAFTVVLGIAASAALYAAVERLLATAPGLAALRDEMRAQTRAMSEHDHEAGVA